MIEARVCGIPCLIEASYTKVEGSYSFHAASDYDYHGYEECEWTVCDRRGRPAPWLERKMDAQDRNDIEVLVIEHFRRKARECDEY